MKDLDLTPPYYAVIFTSELVLDDAQYQHMDAQLAARVQDQPGFLGFQSARSGKTGITVSYWKDTQSIQNWREHALHSQAREQGKNHWYSNYRIEICIVERRYSWKK